MGCTAFPLLLLRIRRYLKGGKIMGMNEATDAFTEKLDRCVKNAAEQKEWRLEYMTLQQKYREEYEAGVEDGIEQGIEQGRHQERQNTAKKLVQMQMPVEKVAQAVGESVETVEQWLAEK